MRDINRSIFCERARFEALSSTINADAKINAFMGFVAERFPNAIITQGKHNLEFEYCRLGYEELRTVNDFLMSREK